MSHERKLAVLSRRATMNQFWNNIRLNFIESNPDKIKTKLTDAQKQRLRDAIGEAIDRRVRAYNANPQSVVNN